MPKEYYGEWKAFSKACVTGSVLKISNGQLYWETQNIIEKYEYFDSSKKLPKAINVPEGNIRYTLKITKSINNTKNSLNLISLSIYNDISEYSMFKKDEPLLAVWWHNYSDDANYFISKEKSEINGSWCLFTKQYKNL